MLLPPVFKKRKIGFTAVGARRVQPAENAVELNDGTTLTLRLSRHRDRPEARLRRNRGSGPKRQHAIGLPRRARRARLERLGRILQESGPIVIGAVPAVSCFGPAYEYALTASPISAAQNPPPRADHLRDLGALYRSSRPRRRRRHQGHAQIRLARPRHQMGHQRQDRPRQTPIRSKRRSSTKTVSPRKTHKIPYELHDAAAGLPGVDCLKGEDGKWIEGLTQSARVRDRRQKAAQRELSEHLRGRRLRRPAAVRADARAGRHAQDRLYDRIHVHAPPPITFGDLVAGKEPTHEGTWNAVCLADFGDSGIAFVGPAANSAAQRQLVGQGPLGASGQGRL